MNAMLQNLMTIQLLPGTPDLIRVTLTPGIKGKETCTPNSALGPGLLKGGKEKNKQLPSVKEGSTYGTLHMPPF